MTPCKDCPAIGESEDAQKAINWGCLAEYHEMVQWHRETGKVWACHANPSRPCAGFVSLSGIDPSGKPLITENCTLEDIYER